MIKKFTLVLLMFCAFSTFAQTNQTNHIIIIDKTGSMIGQAGGTDIWYQVKAAIKSYVNSVEINDKITIYTYAETVSEPKVFNINNESVKNNVNSFIDKIKADGKNTCTYKALKKVFEEYNESQNVYSNLIYLYTDGINNCSGYTMQNVADLFYAKRDDYDYLYYITLGNKIPDDVKKVADGTTTITTQEVPNPENKDNIVPKTIQPAKDILTFNFSNSTKELTQIMPFKTTGNINFDIELTCEFKNVNIQGIELIIKNIELNNNIGEFKIKIKDGSYFKNDIEAEIKLYVIKGNISLINDSFKIKLILPKKGKSTIKFE
jgi:hypothetical protein